MSTDTPGCGTRADGSFLLEVRPGTIWDLTVRGAELTDAFEMVFRVERAVAVGTRELVLQIDVEHPLPPDRRGK